MTDGFIECNAVNIYYRKYGKDGRPLVFLHGNGEDGRIFDGIAQKMSQSFSVYLPDARGHGQSGKVPLSYGEMAKDVCGLIRGLGLVKPLLYGFSDGGITGLILAYQNPGLLSNLAVSGVNLSPKALKFWFRLSVRLGFFFTRDPMLRLMLAEPDITPADLSRITEPVCVLAGAKDIVPAKHSASVAAAIPSGALGILKGESHGSYVLDNGKLFAALSAASFFM